MRGLQRGGRPRRVDASRPVIRFPPLGNERATALGRQATSYPVRTPADLDAAFADLVRARRKALISGTDPVLLDRRDPIVALADRHRLPVVSFTRPFAAAGGLMSYGPDIGWMYRQAGGYIAQILKGARPLPVMQSTRFELVVNLRTARRLGLAIPPSFMASVDTVIE